MIITILQFIALTGAIVAAANYLLYAPAKRITERLNVSNHGAGQLLGYLTSAPELVTTIAVASTGLFATVAYNILSSNIINVVLALTAATCYRQTRRLLTRKLWREHTIITLSIATPILLLVTGNIESPWVIPVFLIGYAAYIITIKHITNTSTHPDTNTAPGPAAVIEAETGTAVNTGADPAAAPSRPRSNRGYVTRQALIILGGLTALYFLGTALGDTVHTLGTTFGVPEIILGTVIGVVTSLPELTTFFASYRWHRRAGSDHANEEVTHNLLASNVSNLLLIQTVGLVMFLIVAT